MTRAWEAASVVIACIAVATGASAQDVSTRAEAKARLELAIRERAAGDLASARRDASAALELYRRLDDRTGQSSALARLGSILNDQQSFDDAAAAFDASRALAADGVWPENEAWTLLQLAAIARIQRNDGRAADAFQRAFELYRGIGKPARAGDAARGIGDVAETRRDYRTADAQYELARALCREGGDAVCEARAAVAKGTLALLHSDFPAVRQMMTEAIRLAQGGDQPQVLAQSYFGLAEVDRIADVFDAARAGYRRSIDLYRQARSREGESGSLAGLAHAEADAHDLVAADRDYRAALEIAVDFGHRSVLSTILNGLCDVDRELGAREPAREQCDYAIALAHRAGDDHAEANALLNLGYLQGANGDRETALRTIANASALYQRLGARLGMANCLRGLGQFGLGIDGERARTQLREAVALYEQIGLSREAGEVRQLLPSG